MSTGTLDIEDVGSSVDSLPTERHARRLVLPKRPQKKDAAAAEERAVGDSHIPGNATIYLRTWGCSHNSSDGEYMAGLLSAYGYRITDQMAKADLWILNSCTVKTPSEDTFNNQIRAAKAAGKHVVVSGCVPQGQPRGKMVGDLSVVGTQQIDRVVEVVEETLQGRTVRLLGKRKGKSAGGGRLKNSPGPRLSLPKIRKNPLIEIIPINSGCLNQCTYCKTKHARGDLASYPPDELVERARSVFEEGVVEIWLTSEDTGTYGRDIGTDLPTLLWRMVEVIPEGCMLRLGMTNPPYILEHVEEIAKILNHPRVYKFLHLPIQSASDPILAAMRREYCRADFCHVVDYLREHVPGVTIATDIIAGFPGETEEDFQESFELCRKYVFPSLFINQFFPRPGTPAASMERIHPQKVKERTRQLDKLFRSQFPYAHKVGETQRVLVTEVSADGVHLVAHNDCFDQVLIAKEDCELGATLDVNITRTGKHFLVGAAIAGTLRPAACNVNIKPRDATSARRRQGPANKAAGLELSGKGNSPPLEDATGWGFYHVLLALFAVLALDLVRIVVRAYAPVAEESPPE